MPLYNPTTIPAGAATAGDLTVTGNLNGSHDITASGTFNASANDGVKLPAGNTPLTPSNASTLYGLSATNLPAYVSASGQITSVGGVLQAQTSTVTVANTGAATALQSYTVPAGDVAAGALYRLTGYGLYSDTGTPTLAFTLYWGGVAGTVLAAVPAVTLGSGVTNVPFAYTAFVTARSITSLWADLVVTLGTSAATDAATDFAAVPTAATTVTTTGANALTVGVTWSAGSASNTISLVGGAVERLA